MLARHRLAPTTAFASIYRKDMRETVISAYVHTVSYISLTNYDLFRHFHVSILPHLVKSLLHAILNSRRRQIGIYERAFSLLLFMSI